MAVSQRMVASEPVTDRFGSEVDADEDRARDLVVHLCRLYGGAREQAGRKVVDEVCGDRDRDAADPASGCVRAGPPSASAHGRSA